MDSLNKDIYVDNISFGYEDFEDNKHKFILDNLTVNIKQGEFVAILGHNGCGKSTLAKHFNAIHIPNLGNVYVSGINTKNENDIYEIKQNVGMVFQNPDNQIVATVVEEDVAFALENLGIEPCIIRQEIDIAMKKTGVFDLKDKSAHQLSGGQKQRVAIAGVIAMKPSFIVLDEPTAMLDPKGRKEVLKTIKELNIDYNITVVLITHYMEEASKADRVIVMDDGQIIMDDLPTVVFSQVDRLKQIGLDIPQVTELIYELNKDGYNLPQDIINEKDCADAILALLKG
ncbi:MAG: energy-coupling factor transporter ATPase [Oscillospiraceae bacterium]